MTYFRSEGSSVNSHVRVHNHKREMVEFRLSSIISTETGMM